MQHIFCLAIFEEKLNKLLDQLNISRISGLTGYPAGQSGIRPNTRYQKRPDYTKPRKIMSDVIRHTGSFIV
jgi:hypothetical protein